LIFLAWTALVACRVIARLISVGAGARGAFGLVVLTVAVNAYWLFAGPLLARLRRFSLRNWNRTMALGAIGALAAVVVVGEAAWYRPVLRAFNGAPLPWREAIISRGDVNLLVVALVLAAGWLSDGFERALERQRQGRELEAVLADAELRLLALQLQPHFLFNALQLAAEAAYDDIAEARDVVRDLQTLLQRAFELEDRGLVPVAEEIEFLGAYVAIQQRRFGARLTVDVRVASDVRGFLLPPLLLQPLVENCIRHGIGPLARDGRIVVSLHRGNEHLLIRVFDNGVGFAPSLRSNASFGLGHGATRRRLDALFPGRYAFDIGNGHSGGAIVSIAIPIVESDTRIRPAPDALRIESHDAVERPWLGGAIAAIALGTLLMLVDVFGSALLLEAATHSTAVVRAPIAMWVPAQLLAFALGLVLWRGRGVRRWLQRRDADTRELNARIAATRETVLELRSGKDVMIGALERLAGAVDAREFDDLTLSAAEAARTLLASDRRLERATNIARDHGGYANASKGG
jgi:hypothetical protein